VTTAAQRMRIRLSPEAALKLASSLPRNAAA
jgi:hypothetical protein